MKSAYTHIDWRRACALVPFGIIALAFLLHGPIAQPNNYHAFADDRIGWGIPHFADVISNLPFALVGLFGLHRIYASNRSAGPMVAGTYGYALFCVALLLTALGSGYYHWAPDNWRLLWDRLPIALACAGLLAAVRAELKLSIEPRLDTLALGLVATLSSLWWYWTELQGQGDLRPYLLMQIAPIVLIPLWQHLFHAASAQRRSIAAAIALYIAAKLVEVNDHALFEIIGHVSGHTLKHVLAAMAALLIVRQIDYRK